MLAVNQLIEDDITFLPQGTNCLLKVPGVYLAGLDFLGCDLTADISTCLSSQSTDHSQTAL
jgi:hypothetical protein